MSDLVPQSNGLALPPLSTTFLSNHRTVEVGRDISRGDGRNLLQRSSGPIPMLKQGHLEPVA